MEAKEVRVWAFCEYPFCGLVTDEKRFLSEPCPKCGRLSLALDRARMQDENREAVYSEHDV